MDLPLSAHIINFNSIKVRLELKEKVRKNALVCLFQFHKGTIRTEVFDMMTTGESHFNSIKVRLERGFLGCLCGLAAQFQFHKGTIRTRYIPTSSL